MAKVNGKYETIFIVNPNLGEEAITAEDAGVTEEAVEAAEATDIEEVADAE